MYTYRLTSLIYRGNSAALLPGALAAGKQFDKIDQPASVVTWFFEMSILEIVKRDKIVMFK